MNDDLISRQTLIDAFKEEFYTMYSDDYNYMIKFFNDLPTADLSEYCDKLWKTAYERGKAEAQPRKGKWNTAYCPKCSVCGTPFYGIEPVRYHYCPNCGAKMEESAEFKCPICPDCPDNCPLEE